MSSDRTGMKGASRGTARRSRPAAGRRQQDLRAEGGRAPARLPRRAAAGLVAAVLAAVGLYAFLGHRGQAAGQVVASDHGVPVYLMVEGQSGYGYPYDPRVLHVRAGRPFAIRLTDNLGGCGLDTVFPGLGSNGGTATASVPVGATRTLTLQAPRPGSYAFHCGSDMYFGQVIAG